MLIAESSSSGTIKAEYVYVNGQPLAKIEGNDIYYYHNDHLGTSVMMTDSSGTTVWEGDFKPFGEEHSVTGSIINNLRFPGQYFDAETELHYNYYRDYNPVIGRYVEADPSGIERGENHLFIYVGNNTVNLIDPRGLLAGGLVRAYQIARALIPKMKRQLRNAYKTCKNIRCKIEKHPADHPFGWPFYEKRKHIHILCYIQGKKGSHIRMQIPY
jgi:RHS repeat-associated protein